jgi:hypothetical protein
MKSRALLSFQSERGEEREMKMQVITATRYTRRREGGVSCGRLFFCWRGGWRGELTHAMGEHRIPPECGNRGQ